MEARYITGTELARLRECLDSESWLVYWVMLETGLRVGDAVALKRGSMRSDGIHFKAQKTGKSGVAEISPALRAVLRQRPSGWLFPSPSKLGKHITRQAVWKRIKEASIRAGLDPAGVSPHAMRKCFAVEMYREKGFEATRKALQHGARDTTEIYAYSDFTTGENADKPLTRRDLKMIVGLVCKALFAPSAERVAHGKKK